MEKEVVVGDEGGADVIRLWLRKPDGSHLVVEFGAGENALLFSLFEERLNDSGAPEPPVFLANADIVRVRENVYNVNFWEQNVREGTYKHLGKADIDITTA